MRKKDLIRIVLICLLCVPLLLGSSYNNKVMVTETHSDSVVYTSSETEESTDTVNFDSILIESIIEEVDNHINKHTSKAPDSLARMITTICLEHDIDICFAVAQTQLETCFGTAGIGRNNSRKSIFGVYKTYKTYEECIYSYCRLLRKSYLVKGRTEQDLMNNYVTYGNYRYAENPDYEKSLKALYNKVKGTTKIYELQQQYGKI